MAELRRSIDEFLTRLHRRYTAAAAPAVPPAAEFRSLLAVWPEAREPTLPTPKRLPACDHLATALSAGLSGPEAELAEALSELAPALAWTYSYPAARVNPIYPAPSPSARSSGPVGSGGATACGWA